MFWSDPNLYGASFPYKDINTPTQTPIGGPAWNYWQNIPRVTPPAFGFNPYLHMTPMGFNPYAGVPQINNPMLNNPMLNTPFFNTPQLNTPLYNVPAFNPYAQMNVPFYGYHRPFTF